MVLIDEAVVMVVKKYKINKTSNIGIIKPFNNMQ